MTYLCCSISPGGPSTKSRPNTHPSPSQSTFSFQKSKWRSWIPKASYSQVSRHPAENAITKSHSASQQDGQVWDPAGSFLQQANQHHQQSSEQQLRGAFGWGQQGEKYPQGGWRTADTWTSGQPGQLPERHLNEYDQIFNRTIFLTNVFKPLTQWLSDLKCIKRGGGQKLLWNNKCIIWSGFRPKIQSRVVIFLTVKWSGICDKSIQGVTTINFQGWYHVSTLWLWSLIMDLWCGLCKIDESGTFILSELGFSLPQALIMSLML